MPSTYSSNLKLELMATGENSGTWGNITNTNLGTAAEQAIVGYGSVVYASDANLTISITNSNAAQAARALVLNVTSSLSLTGTRELVVPTIEKQYIVQNNTTGSQSITVKTSAGTGITVPNGRKAHLYVDGTNVIQMFDFVDINGGTIDGTPIGGSSAAAGSFTTLGASGAATFNGAVTLGDAAADLIVFNGTVNSHLLFTDNTYDIGANGATRPRNLFLAGAATIGGNLSVGGTLTLTGGVNLNGNVTVGDSSADTLTINSTITSNLLFTDNTYDIGASGATRPRNLFLAGNATIGGATTMTGALTVDSTTDSSSTTTGSIQTDGGLGVAKNVYIGGTTVSQTNSATVSHSVVSTGGNALLNLDANTGAGAFSPQLSFKSSGTSKWAIGGGNIGSGGANDFGMYDYANGKLTYSVLATGGSMLMNTNLLFVDNTYDIGASGNSRPRDLYLSGSISVNLGAVFNELGGDYDFRVESDTNTHMLFVDAGTNTVNIGGTPPTYPGLLNVGGGGIFTNATTFDPDLADAGTILLGNINDGGGFAAPGIGWKTSGAGNTAAVVAASGVLYFGTGDGATTNSIKNRLEIGVGGVVFNQQAQDVDFRVESVNRSHMLFVDASTDQVTMGQSTPRANATLTLGYSGVSPSYNAQLSIDANTNSGTGQAVVELLAGSGSTNRASRINFLNGVASTTTPRWILINDYDQNGTNDFRLVNAATQTMMVFTQSGGVVFNEDSVDYDFRVESDTSTHALFVDAGSNLVNINDSNNFNAARLFVNGNINAGYSNTIAMRYNVSGQGNAYYKGMSGTEPTGVVARGLHIFNYDQDSDQGINFWSGYPGGTNYNLAYFGPGATGAVVFNDDGLDRDFRVESDNNTHMLFVDAGNDVVSIGTSTVPNWYSGDTLQSNTWAITSLLGTDQSGWSTGCYQDAYGYSTNWKFKGNYPATLYTQTGDHTFLVTASTRGAGNAITWRNVLALGDSAAVFNEDSNDVDFRVESDANTHAVFVDAGLGTVNINGTGPGGNADVAGFQNNSSNGVLSSSSTVNVSSFARTQYTAATNNATVDAFRFLDHGGAVFATSLLAGHFYVNVTGASGVNQFAAVYSVVTTGNGFGLGDSSVTLVSSSTRGTSPVASVAIASDGAGGAIKFTITYINNSGVVTGGGSTVTFLGQVSNT